MDNNFKLTQTDLKAIDMKDSNHLCAKGADFYAKKDYEKAAEYYHLAASMGNVNAVSNLGYCYLYGRHTQENLSLALAYLKIAAMMHDIDAIYKLGDIYGNDKRGCEDKEMSVYFYRMAASYILGYEWDEPYGIADCDQLLKYPSLCFALGRESMPEGLMKTNLDNAYQFLKQAREGYKEAIANGDDFYQKCYDDVVELTCDPIFKDFRDKYEFTEEEDLDS